MTGAGANDWPSHGVPKSVLLNKPFAPAQIVTAVAQLLNQCRRKDEQKPPQLVASLISNVTLLSSHLPAPQILVSIGVYRTLSRRFIGSRPSRYTSGLCERQSFTIATARVQPAEPRSIFTGKQETMKPVDGKLSRLCSFSRWQ